MIVNSVKESVALIPSTSRVTTVIGGNLVTEPFASVMLDDGEREPHDFLGTRDTEASEPTEGFEQTIALHSQRRAERVDSPNAWVQAGYAAIAAGQNDDAEYAFRKAISIDPSNRAALLGLARSQHAKGDSAGAVELLEAILAKDPNDLEAVVSLAIVTLSESGPAEAIKLLERSPETSPSGASLLATRGAMHLQLNNYVAAIRDFRKALRLKPEWGHVWNAMGLAQLTAGRSHQAETSFRRSIRTAPAYPDGVINLLRLLKLEHRWSDLLNTAEHAWHSSTPPIVVARLAAEAGLELDDARAARSWLERVRTQPGSAEDRAAIYNNLGVCYLRLRDIDAADRAFVVSVEALPSETNVGNRALALLDTGKAVEAVAWLGAWVTEPGFNSIRLSNLLIRSCLRAEDPTRAYALALAQANRQDANETTLGLLSWLAVDYAGEPEVAIRACRRGLLEFPHTIWLYNNLAYALLQAGRADEAEAVLIAAQSEPDAFNCRVHLTATQGLLELHRGNIAAGRELYEKALAFAGPEPLRERVKVKRDLEIARALLALGGNIGDARRLLERAAEGGPETEPYRAHAALELRRLAPQNRA